MWLLLLIPVYSILIVTKKIVSVYNFIMFTGIKEQHNFSCRGPFFTWNYDSTLTRNHKGFRPRACSFCKGAVTFRAKRPQIFKSKPVGKEEAQLLPHIPVNFASLTDCFKLPFSILLNWLWPWMQTWHTLNSSPGLKNCRHFRETSLLMVIMWYCPFLL